jgi:dipeptidyl-peptidase 4
MRLAVSSSHSHSGGGGVGIIGGSAGGQTVVKALLDYGHFFKVGVADCGCHDNRVDKLWWNEAFLGRYDHDRRQAYDACSNVMNAHKLSDDVKLMLVVGERCEATHISVFIAVHV